MAYILPLADDSFGDEEKHAMISVIESGHYTMGEKVAEFEDAFSYCCLLYTSDAADE